MTTVLPYGSWVSPITAASLVEQAVSLGQVEVDGERVYWLEGRPSEGGRQVVVTWAPGTEPRDAIGTDWSARTTVHEYGGGAYAVAGDVVFFSHFADQRLYRVDPGEAPRPLTPEPPEPMVYRYADARVSPDGRRLVCVRERHLEGEVVNDIGKLASGSIPAMSSISSCHRAWRWASGASSCPSRRAARSSARRGCGTI